MAVYTNFLPSVFLVLKSSVAALQDLKKCKLLELSVVSKRLKFLSNLALCKQSANSEILATLIENQFGFSVWL